MRREYNVRLAYGNLNIWVGSLGFATVMKLPPDVELDEPPESLEGWTILTESSSISDSSLGRRRAAILTLWVAMVVEEEASPASLVVVEIKVAGRMLNWSRANHVYVLQESQHLTITNMWVTVTLLGLLNYGKITVCWTDRLYLAQISQGMQKVFNLLYKYINYTINIL